jgi:hypothetical protein
VGADWGSKALPSESNNDRLTTAGRTGPSCGRYPVGVRRFVVLAVLSLTLGACDSNRVGGTPNSDAARLDGVPSLVELR